VELNPFQLGGLVPNHFLLTPLAGRVLRNASASAFTLSRDFLDTEHILHAMLSEDRAIGIEILKGFCIDLEKIRKDIETPRKRRALPSCGVELPATSSVQKVLQTAFENCKANGRINISTGDLLVGIVAERNGLTANILHKRGITFDYLDDIRDEAHLKCELNDERL